MATLDDDRYKSEAKLTFKIEKFHEFARPSVFGVDRFSDSTFIQGLDWDIWIYKKPAPDYIVVNLCFNPEEAKSSAWSCEASFTLNILSQKKENEFYDEQESRHVFCKKSQCYTRHYELKKLMDPNNGWYDKETDSITIEAYVKAKVPRGFGLTEGGQLYCATKDWLLETGDNSICTIVFVDPLDAANNKEYKMHKNVLALHSDVFRAMFTNEGTKECRESRVVIKDSTHMAIRQMLYFMYSGKFPSELKQEDALELLDIANKYNIDQFAMHSEEKLMKSLAVENVCALLMWADRYNCHSLRIACGEMIRENLDTVQKQNEWAALWESSPHLVTTVLDESTKKEEEKDKDCDGE